MTVTRSATQQNLLNTEQVSDLFQALYNKQSQVRIDPRALMDLGYSREEAESIPLTQELYDKVLGKKFEQLQHELTRPGYQGLGLNLSDLTPEQKAAMALGAYMYGARGLADKLKAAASTTGASAPMEALVARDLTKFAGPSALAVIDAIDPNAMLFQPVVINSDDGGAAHGHSRQPDHARPGPGRAVPTTYTDSETQEGGDQERAASENRDAGQTTSYAQALSARAEDLKAQNPLLARAGENLGRPVSAPTSIATPAAAQTTGAQEPPAAHSRPKVWLARQGSRLVQDAPNPDKPKGGQDPLAPQDDLDTKVPLLGYNPETNELFMPHGIHPISYMRRKLEEDTTTVIERLTAAKAALEGVKGQLDKVKKPADLGDIQGGLEKHFDIATAAAEILKPAPGTIQKIEGLYNDLQAQMGEDEYAPKIAQPMMDAFTEQMKYLRETQALVDQAAALKNDIAELAKEIKKGLKGKEAGFQAAAVAKAEAAINGTADQALALTHARIEDNSFPRPRPGTTVTPYFIPISALREVEAVTKAVQEAYGLGTASPTNAQFKEWVEGRGKQDNNATINHGPWVANQYFKALREEATEALSEAGFAEAIEDQPAAFQSAVANYHVNGTGFVEGFTYNLDEGKARAQILAQLEKLGYKSFADADPDGVSQAVEAYKQGGLNAAIEAFKTADAKPIQAAVDEKKQQVWTWLNQRGVGSHEIDAALDALSHKALFDLADEKAAFAYLLSETGREQGFYEARKVILDKHKSIGERLSPQQDKNIDDITERAYEAQKRQQEREERQRPPDVNDGQDNDPMARATLISQGQAKAATDTTPKDSEESGFYVGTSGVLTALPEVGLGAQANALFLGRAPGTSVSEVRRAMQNAGAPVPESSTPDTQDQRVYYAANTQNAPQAESHPDDDAEGFYVGTQGYLSQLPGVGEEAQANALLLEPYTEGMGPEYAPRMATGPEAEPEGQVYFLDQNPQDTPPPARFVDGTPPAAGSEDEDDDGTPGPTPTFI